MRQAPVEAEVRGAFRRIWAAAAVSNLGDGIGLTALPLLVVSLTQDPVLVAAAAASLQLPWLLFALPSGVLVDRIDRRLAMVSTDLLRAGVVGFLAWLVGQGQAQLAVICVVSFALSSAETVFDPASEAILPLVVPEHALPTANARLEGTSAALNNLVGPPVGAILFTAAAALPFVVDAASFLVSALVVLTISGSYRATRSGPTRPMLAEVRAGLGWLGHHPVFRYTAPLAGLINIGAYAVLAVLVVYTRESLGVDDVGFGLTMAAIGVGGVAGALSAGAVIGRLGEARALQLPAWVMAIAVAVGVASASPVVFAAGLAGGFFAAGVWNVAHVSLRQELTPDELRGRVAGANKLITWGARPIGAALGGIVAAAFGLAAPCVLAAGIFVTAGLVALARLDAGAIAAARSSHRAGQEPG